MNVNKICAQCKQIVYPLEQVNCLDQFWHRRCFRCEKCGMALNMGNYRGYEKKPYCTAHYPQPKRFTVVADTPEFQRVAQNSRLFSSVNYDQRHQKAGSVNRGRLHSANSVDSSPPPGANGARLRQGSRTYQLYQMGESLPANGLRHENGNSRHVYSASSMSSSQMRTSSEAHDSSADAQSPVHYSNNVPHEERVASWGQQEVVSHSTNHTASPKSTSSTFRAIYPYDAKEDDEVSFRDGDIITHGDPITDGWMYGIVQRTGKFGMLPSNYVEPID